jgi:hypothetical protein
VEGGVLPEDLEERATRCMQSFQDIPGTEGVGNGDTFDAMVGKNARGENILLKNVVMRTNQVPGTRAGYVEYSAQQKSFMTIDADFQLQDVVITRPDECFNWSLKYEAIACPEFRLMLGNLPPRETITLAIAIKDTNLYAPNGSCIAGVDSAAVCSNCDVEVAAGMFGLSRREHELILYTHPYTVNSDGTLLIALPKTRGNMRTDLPEIDVARNVLADKLYVAISCPRNKNGSASRGAASIGVDRPDWLRVERNNEDTFTLGLNWTGSRYRFPEAK